MPYPSVRTAEWWELRPIPANRGASRPRRGQEVGKRPAESPYPQPIETLMTATTVANPRGRPGYEATLPCAPQSARPARNLVVIVLSVWALDDLAEDAALVVTELVANAARHTTGSRLRVCVTRPGGHLVRVAVADHSPVPPALLCAGPRDEYGRGLTVVTALAEAWGATPLRRGKRVWAELRSTRP